MYPVGIFSDIFNDNQRLLKQTQELVVDAVSLAKTVMLLQHNTVFHSAFINTGICVPFTIWNPNKANVQQYQNPKEVYQIHHMYRNQASQEYKVCASQ